MNKQFTLIRIIVLLTTIASTYCFGQIPMLANEYSVKKLTAEDGFVSSEIYSIIQDQQGLLWFGTAENGVMRYDGRKVTLFEFDSTSTNGLSHNDAGNLMQDRHGNVWVGTWGGGANRYDPQTGQFENFLHDPKRPESLSANRIQSLYHDLDDSIWLGSYDKGLNRYLGNNQFEHIVKAQQGNLGLSHNRVWDIENNDVHSLWVATSYGLNLYNKTTQTFHYFFPNPDNNTPTGANEIRHILKASNGKLYVGTQKGPFIFEPTVGQFTQLGVVGESHLGQVNSMIEDHEGHIWFVTSKGVFRLSHLSQKIEQLDLEHNSGLRVIFEDNSKTIWITNEVHGIYKLVPHRKFKSINSPELVAPNGIITDDNGDLLIVTSSSELFKWHTSTQKLEPLTSSIFHALNGFDENRLLERPVLYLSDAHTLWVAQDEGLAKFDLATKHIELLTYPDTEPHHEEFREIRALNVDKHGKLWIGTYKNGVYTYDIKNKKFSHLDERLGLSHPEVLEIYKDNAHNMWVGTGEGVNLWLEERHRFQSFITNKYKSDSLLGSIVQDIHQSRDGNIWIATQKGLNLYQPQSQSFTHISTEHGLPTTLIRAIADDKEGNLWLTTNKGVSKYAPLTGDVDNFDSQNGLLGLNYYPSSLIKGKDNTLFTSSQRGIEYFSTLPLELSQSEPNLILTGFSKMGQSAKLGMPYSYVTDIEISYLDYIFSFEFSVLDFISPSKNQYAYKLVGYDDNWIEIGNRNTASFTNLDGGSYQFQVKATNSNGKWGENILSINLYVSPPPWLTWWAYCLYALILASIIFVVIYMRTRLQKAEIIRQKQFVVQLEEQVSEKTASLETQARDLADALQEAEAATQLKSEFLANMSHEIRTPMNGVLGMLDILKNTELTSEQAHSVNIASASAHSLLTLINDILDFSKIEADKLELEYIDFDLRKLIEQLSESIALPAQKKGVEIILDLADIHTQHVNSDPGRIRQILTNILSNAIKFTEQGDVTISAQLEATNDADQYVFKCLIRDTGIGIPKAKISALFDSFSQVDTSTTRKYGGTGLGLSITKRLCQLLNGDVTASSEEGLGSCFTITCLVNKSTVEGKETPSYEHLNLNLLIVDGNASSIDALRKQYEQWGVKVFQAMNATDAIYMCNKHSISNDLAKFDTVLFNNNLPDMTGELLVKALKKEEKYANLKLVMMTQLGEQYDTNEIKKSGVNSVFSKPATAFDLLNTLAITNEEIKATLSDGHQSTQQATHDELTVSDNEWVKRTHVLLVEDNKVNQLVALRVLSNMGLIADVAENGVEALSKLKESNDTRPYTVILMDCQMPEMDGYEATKHIREGQTGRYYMSIPIIAMTANAMQGDKQKCLDAGMDDYITKPIDASNVLQVVQHWAHQIHG
ncbi:hybrid sensor histidine kinase/response regulator [Pseudoalteromonas sp. MMG005]|uniref:hybrid sensor histidine kinase/response regulator n=1 Tax=Pseudoalteromonas sp. MMG005 TaxID=2822682 RepID=UPI001B3A1470|nr:hybrid sensor histidine kinase/response regulator [Pseudoalteromonas sp. MMG005]MBQ4847603.1 response regulator [Pseudoalteromonas sp. MMG005]